ncbi:MAG: hypothetical protein CM15mP113_1600 [Pseudomonadota bacterium]|nr:MAG: hypothetical protein CM15mP113_1600 [Pseudomonadota bacterium]
MFRPSGKIAKYRLNKLKRTKHQKLREYKTFKQFTEQWTPKGTFTYPYETRDMEVYWIRQELKMLKIMKCRIFKKY